MILEFWNTALYQPVFNFLIWIYSNWTDQNFGWAIIYLTLILRGLLLPLSVVQHMKRVQHQELGNDVGKIQKQFHNDEILKKQQIRKLLKQRKVNPWAKIASLAIQGLVLVLLYQVFLNGITGEKIYSVLYSWIQFPGKINTMFYGFDLGKVQDLWWSGAVGLLLFLENYIPAKKNKRKFQKRDLSYFVLFPFAVFVLLWILPMVKSLFVLTSMVFSIIVDFILSIFIRAKKTIKPEQSSST